MDSVGCLVCGEPQANCFRSNKRILSFDVTMVHWFEELIVCLYFGYFCYCELVFECILYVVCCDMFVSTV